LFGSLVATQTRHRSTAEALSFATAYAGLALLVAALAIGPLNLVRRKPNPTSTDLRRDIGIWAGVFGIVHTIAGLQVHMHGELLRYFVIPSGGRNFDTLGFVAANWLGLLSVLLLVVLVSISSDAALRFLGKERWKLLQQSAYVVIVAVIVHGALYQILEKRRWFLASIFSLLAIVVVVFQWAGANARRKTRVRHPE
jgi:sulfoxide reductase heme-binding subunit YedZ